MEKILNDIVSTLDAMNASYVASGSINIADMSQQSKVNFSESQAALYEAWKKLRKFHQSLSSDFNSKTIRENAARLGS